MLDSLKAIDALDFFEKSFALSEALKNDLMISNNPIIVFVIGTARSGKSTLCNILFNPVLHPKVEIFKTDEGNEPVTLQIQYAKTKLSQLLEIHKIEFEVPVDSDLFIFDCEGIDSLGEVTESLRKAIFTFLQISTINIFVSKNIDHSNIFNLKSFFLLPQLIGGEKPLSKGSAIVLTDNGVSGNPSEEEYEEKRRLNDQNELNKIFLHLEKSHIIFSKENTAFFAQPKWAKENHYFESINDLIRFILNIISNRIQIPGSTLIQIFERCIPIIAKINDLDDPDIKLDTIVQNIIKDFFQQSYDFAIKQTNKYINDFLDGKSANELVQYSKTEFYIPIEKQITEIYYNKANDLYQNIKISFPDMNKEYSKSLKKETRSILIDSFEKKCQITVIPFISNQVLCKTKEMMIIDISQMKSDMLIFSKIPEFIIHYQNVAKDMFDNQLQSICNNLINSPQYNSHLTFLNSSICHEVVMIEINERINRIDKISKDNDSRINEIKNMLDEFINVLHQVQENSNQIGQIIGTFFYSARIEDKLPGSLKCNGQIINAAEYPDFVENYLKKKLVALVPINEWHKIKRETNNVGCFGYDQNGGIFIAPFIPSGTFLSNASIEYINGHIIL